MVDIFRRGCRNPMTMRQTSYASYYTKISAAGGRYDSSLLHLYGTNDEERWMLSFRGALYAFASTLTLSSQAVISAGMSITAGIVYENEPRDLREKWL